jgi:hypothetical protein
MGSKRPEEGIERILGRADRVLALGQRGSSGKEMPVGERVFSQVVI